MKSKRSAYIMGIIMRSVYYLIGFIARIEMAKLVHGIYAGSSVGPSTLISVVETFLVLETIWTVFHEIRHEVVEYKLNMRVAKLEDMHDDTQIYCKTDDASSDGR